MAQFGFLVSDFTDRFYGITTNVALLVSVPLGVTTSTVPVVAPAGTVVVIKVFDTTVNVDGVPLKVTLVAPVRSVPRIPTRLPTVAPAGTVFTNWPRPVERLKTVPSPLVPPTLVVP